MIRGVYKRKTLILITVTISTKLMLSDGTNNRIPSLFIDLDLSLPVNDLNFDVRNLASSSGSSVLTPLLAYPYFKLDFEQDATQKRCQSSKKQNKLNDFVSKLCTIP